MEDQQKPVEVVDPKDPKTTYILNSKPEVDKYLMDAYAKAKEKISSFDINRDMEPKRFEHETRDEYRARRTLATKIIKNYLKNGPGIIVDTSKFKK